MHRCLFCDRRLMWFSTLSGEGRCHGGHEFHYCALHEDLVVEGGRPPGGGCTCRPGRTWRPTLVPVGFCEAPPAAMPNVLGSNVASAP